MKQVQVDCKKLWMSQKEAMKYLGVSRDWLRDRILDGRLHFSCVGKTTFYIKSEIDRIVRENAVTGVNHFRETR